MTSPQLPNVQSVTAAEIPTEKQLQADQWARDALKERLPRIRAVATVWSATVTAIFAVFGLAALTDADDMVRSLEVGYDLAFGITGLVAGLIASTSIVLASLASQTKNVDLEPGLAEREIAFEEAYIHATRLLLGSRLCAGLAVLLMIVNLSIRWYAPNI